MATETHIAGLQLNIGERYLVQRCAWCGAVLLHYDATRIAVAGEWQPPSLFPVGQLVRCTYDGVARWGEIALSRTMMVVLDDEKMPDDACPLNLTYDVVFDR